MTISTDSSFADTQTHWAKDSIHQLFTRQIISGYPDGSFRPNNSVTRAEFAAILNKAFPQATPVRDAINFRDVPANHWANSAIQTVTRAGFFSGYPNGTFRPNQPIPRVQALVALVSGLQYDRDPNPNPILQQYYDDAATIPNYARGAIATATDKFLVVNYPDVRRLHPNRNATRGEVAALISRALNLPGVPRQYVPGWDIIAIEPLFDAADSFVQGRARVKLGDKWGYIDKTGTFIVDPQLYEAEPFSEGIALVRLQQNGVDLSWVRSRHFSARSAKALTTNARNQLSPPEIRGVWLTTTDSQVFNSQKNIAEAMDFLAETGFNVVFPVVWKNGATLYPSRLMRDTVGLEIDPRFTGRDPLAELIQAAKNVGLAVIPWFEYGFASSYNQKGGRILAQKPDWAARDRQGNLLTKNNFEWLNAFDPQVQDFIIGLILEVIRNYDIAGIQGDDRLPALPSEGGYDQQTVQRYVQQFNQEPPKNPKDAQWLQWRADLLTDFLTRLYRQVVTINPNLIISIAPSPYPWGFQEYLQDNQAWADQGLIDMMHPQFYRRDFASYQQLVDRLVNDQLSPVQLSTVIPGILIKSGSYRISSQDLVQAIEYNRDRGLAGEVLFFYEGLRQDNDTLANALRSHVYAQSVPFNIAQVKAQGFTHRRVGAEYRYIDRFGNLVTQPEFDWLDSFQEERARVRMGYKWGYIDKTGHLITRLDFDQADQFAEGLARVKIGSRYGYIDLSGQSVISPQFDQATRFSEGLAAVKVGDEWGYIDKIGQWVIPTQFDQAELFSEGLAGVQLAGKYGYCDQTGQLVIPANFDAAGSFAQELAPVQLRDRWGYINSTGELVIEPQFDAAQPFSQELAAVKIGSFWGYINKKGDPVISPEFDQVRSFSDGLAPIQMGKRWGYIRNLFEKS
ncbi:MAG: WG repeat-containing protein [Coleofasciculus sp. B1-GNL1-01]|uniref:WG repeat-containing protein n=1 Tax=Coleofasciculus sp. B1-GNL1-01 TaxID=3068484 RepID=UPI0032FC0701